VDHPLLRQSDYSSVWRGKPSQMIEALFPPLGDHDKTCEKELDRAAPAGAGSRRRSVCLVVRIIRRKTASHFFWKCSWRMFMTRFSESVSFNKVLHAPASDAAAGEKANLGTLPEWNLADLYPSADSPELKSDIEKAIKDAAAFEE